MTLSSCIDAMDKDIDITPWESKEARVVMRPWQLAQIVVLAVGGWALYSEAKDTKTAVNEMRSEKIEDQKAATKQNERIVILEERLSAFREQYEKDMKKYIRDGR